MREADGPEEGRFPALVGAGDQDQAPVIDVVLVADDGSLHGEGKAHVVEPAEPVPSRAGQVRFGQTHRRIDLLERIPQVETTDVERQLGTQDLEKAQDVLGGLAEGVRDVVGSAVAQVC